ncbi:MAG: S49 family peptidase [Gammaproteobacteria bacterium]|nr:S49 family peptidase [Gammaproteobacteria bacterium]
MSDNDHNSPSKNSDKSDARPQPPTETEQKQGASVQQAKSATKEPHWERDLLTRVALAAHQEQRRSRRWGIFFKSLTFAYLAILLIAFLPDKLISETGSAIGKKHTALIDIQGVIAGNTEASADRIIRGLRGAFEDKNTAAVILRINSPGGSPVQAGYVNDEISRLRALYPDVPLYAVVTDICASGGYYIAAAADKIYADKASIVGSIGVLMDGFGFVDTMNKVGVERRLFTAGENKAFLDPFSPMKEGSTQHIQSMLDSIHRQFIDVVKKGRGERLADDPDLFSGLFWSGERGVELGLVDSLGSSSYVAREVVGAEDIKDFTYRTDYLERFAERIGATFANTLSSMGSVQLR